MLTSPSSPPSGFKMQNTRSSPGWGYCTSTLQGTMTTQIEGEKRLARFQKVRTSRCTVQARREKNHENTCANLQLILEWRGKNHSLNKPVQIRKTLYSLNILIYKNEEVNQKNRLIRQVRTRWGRRHSFHSMKIGRTPRSAPTIITSPWTSSGGRGDQGIDYPGQPDRTAAGHA